MGRGVREREREGVLMATFLCCMNAAFHCCVVVIRTVVISFIF